jgi:serine/threonine protein kinase
MVDVGSRLADRFVVLDELGEGGMGAVFRVRDEKLNRECALKVLHARLLRKDPTARERFIREARATGNVRSEHIVQVIDFDENPGGVPWMAMELLEGETLEDRVARAGPLPPDAACRLVLQLGHGLGAAHDAGVVHMDLKPANIFLARVQRVDEGEVLKILDFGLARVIERDRTSAHNTRAMGTYAWSAPEQYHEGRVHKSVDVWPLGLLAFWMLTGRQYWRAQNADSAPGGRDLALLREVTDATVPLEPASARAARYGVASRLPPDFDGWFARCVHHDPAQRFTDGTVATAALAALLQAPARPSLAPRDVTRVDRPSVPRGLTVPAPTQAVPGMAHIPGFERTQAVPELAGRTTAPLEILGAAPPLDTDPGVPPPRRAPWLAGAAVGAAALLAVIALRPSSPTTRPPPPPAPSLPPPPPPPTVDNPWIPIAPATPGVVLGVAFDDVSEYELGFRPSRRVLAPTEAFALQQHEVTWAEYAAYARRAGAAPPPAPGWVPADEARRARLPVTGLRRAEAQRYCEALGGTLPTDEQWEWAARGAALRPHPWGREPIDPARTHFDRRRPSLTPVMQSPQDRTPGDAASALYDLAGNAREWTASVHRLDLPNQDEGWIRNGSTVFYSVRGLPPQGLPVHPFGDNQPPETSAAWHQSLCGSEVCPGELTEVLQFVGFRCARSAAP